MRTPRWGWILSLPSLHCPCSIIPSPEPKTLVCLFTWPCNLQLLKKEHLFVPQMLLPSTPTPSLRSSLAFTHTPPLFTFFIEFITQWNSLSLSTWYVFLCLAGAFPCGREIKFPVPILGPEQLAPWSPSWFPSPGNPLEMQVLRPSPPRPEETETLGVGPSNLF